MRVFDGLRNIVANLGTARDKASHSKYDDNPTVEVSVLNAMYRGSSIARKIVDLPAEDSLREWREWQADKDAISKLEAEETRLGLQGKLLKLRKRGRLYGGAAMFIGTGDNDLSLPLDPSKIQKGGLRYLTVLNRDALSPAVTDMDPRSPTYGKPVAYNMSTGTGGLLTIHPTRLVISEGEELPDDFMSNSTMGWGDSVLLSTMDQVRNLDATAANIASLVFEAKIDVIGISGFNEGLRSGGKKYEQLVLDRASLSATGKGINGTLVMDALDKYEQKSATFATLPDILDRFMQLTSSAASIPVTLLFGVSPGGLNATGDADIRGYYDRIKVQQTLEISPATAILNECLIRSALGNRPEDIFYNWRPLWQPTTKERAETGKIVADTFKTVNDMNLLPPEALANAIVNGLTESGLAPGLEGDVAAWYEENKVAEEGDNTGTTTGEEQDLDQQQEVEQ